MSKNLVLVAVACVLFATAGLVAATAPSAFGQPPPGVPPELWHSLGPNLGLYLEPTPTTAPPRGRLPMASRVTGTLMAKIEGRWVTVDLRTDNGPHFASVP